MYNISYVDNNVTYMSFDVFIDISIANTPQITI